MNDEKKKVLSILRCLIISTNPRNGLNLRKLLDDFEQNEGKQLPLFEYNTALEFLQASGEFDITKYDGGVSIVHARTSPKSKHISTFVAEQTNSRIYRNQKSVQQRLIQKNQLVYSNNHYQPSKPRVLHPGTSTVFSFEQLKAQKEGTLSEFNNQARDIEYNRNVVKTFDKIDETRNNVFEAFVVEYQEMDESELPWSDENWSLVITHCVSTKEIWGRLTGKQCQIDMTAVNVQKVIQSNTKRAVTFNVGRIYVTIIRGIAHRIRMDSIDCVKNQILCFFVDEGDKKWLDMNSIYDCGNRFIKYPPQAICFSLRGLENFPANQDIARKCLESQLLGRSITGQIFTTKENFISHNQYNGTKQAIQVDFLDASGNVIDLRREIPSQMDDKITVPELVTMKLTAVEISHIADNGDIFCHLQPCAVDYVKTLITEFIRKVSNNPSEKTPISFQESLFVVQDSDTNKLYRAELINKTDDGRCNMYFIDYGYSKLIPSSKMYPIKLQYMEDEIYKYPPQAIRTKLIGVSNLAIESSVIRLRSHFSMRRKAYIRRMQSSIPASVPEIKLYFDAESFMVCVNDSLEWEDERGRIIDSSDSAVSDVTPATICTHSIVDRKFVETTPQTSTIGIFLPPELNSCFEVEIVKTESPSNFVIKPTEHKPQWQKQMKDLQSYCKKTSSPVTPDMIKDGQPYACLKSNGFWYRAIIKFHRTQMYAFFCDIAEIDIITDLKKIRPLPKEYLTIPKQAVDAKLFGIEPANGAWEMDDNVQFLRMTKGNKFMAQVVTVIHGKSEENSILEIILKHKQNVINDLFVVSGRAIQSKSRKN